MIFSTALFNCHLIEQYPKKKKSVLKLNKQQSQILEEPKWYSQALCGVTLTHLYNNQYRQHSASLKSYGLMR